MGGWSLYAHEGKLKYCYNFLGITRTVIASDAPLPAGTHQARMESTYDGRGIGKGAAVTLFVDGRKAGEGHVERTHALFFSMDETTEVGCDAGEPVSEDYEGRDNAYNGAIKWVQIDIDSASQDADHQVAPEERFNLLMARQ